MKSIDLSKPIQARDGREVKILGPSDSNSDIIAVAYKSPHSWVIGHVWEDTFQRNKGYECDSDVINVCDRKSLFYRVYKDTSIGVMGAGTVALARAGAIGNNVNNILEIVYEDGIAVSTAFHSVVE